MSDLIRRSDVLEALGDRPENWTDSDEEIQACADWDAFHGIVTRLPAVDAVEVVRCRECKYCQIADPYEAWCYGGLPAQLTRLDEDFCSRGKRREEADT